MEIGPLSCYYYLSSGVVEFSAAREQEDKRVGRMSSKNNSVKKDESKKNLRL